MKKKIDKKQEENKIIKKMKYSISNMDRVAVILNAIGTLGISVLPLLNECINEKMWFYRIVFAVCLLIVGSSVLLHIYSFRKTRKYEEKYNYYIESKKISTALLTALKRTDYEKTLDILKSTRGSTPEWNPINYEDNVLVYNIHQHLHEICIQLKELVVDISSKQLNDDMVTVDIAFQYPSDEKYIKKDGKESNTIGKTFADCEKDKTKWKIITSGDHTSAKINMHKYLSDPCSFYNYLGEQGYVYCNDKNELAVDNHYIWTSKDDEHKRNGSVIGRTIVLKNDNPEEVFVKAFLTISTYGRKLVEEDDLLDTDQFEKLFKETVINNFKTLVETEFAQMFIRHGIRKEYIDKKTGKLL